MVWNSARDSAWLSMFPKKHMPEHIIQRGIPKGQRGKEDGGSCAPAFQTPGCRFLYVSPLVHDQRIKAGVLDQSDQPARPAREAVPKIVDQCPSASTPGWICLRAGPRPEHGVGLALQQQAQHLSASVRQSVSQSVWLSACDVQLCLHRR